MSFLCPCPKILENDMSLSLLVLCLIHICIFAQYTTYNISNFQSKYVNDVQLLVIMIVKTIGISFRAFMKMSPKFNLHMSRRSQVLLYFE